MFAIGAMECGCCGRWMFNYGKLSIMDRSPYHGFAVCRRRDCQQAAFNHNACKWNTYELTDPMGMGMRIVSTGPPAWNRYLPSEFWYVKNKGERRNEMARTAQIAGLARGIV